MKRVIITALAISFSALSLIAEAKIYKWKDDKGQVHYASTPPKPHEKNFDLEKDLSFFSKAATAVPDNVDEKMDEKQKTNHKLKKSSEKRLKFCHQERRNLTLLKKNSTVTWIEKDKETQLSGKLLEDKIQTVEKNIKINCPTENQKQQE